MGRRARRGGGARVAAQPTAPCCGAVLRPLLARSGGPMAGGGAAWKAKERDALRKSILAFGVGRWANVRAEPGSGGVSGARAAGAHAQGCRLGRCVGALACTCCLCAYMPCQGLCLVFCTPCRRWRRACTHPHARQLNRRRCRCTPRGAAAWLGGPGLCLHASLLSSSAGPRSSAGHVPQLQPHPGGGGAGRLAVRAGAGRCVGLLPAVLGRRGGGGEALAVP